MSGTKEFTLIFIPLATEGSSGAYIKCFAVMLPWYVCTSTGVYRVYIIFLISAQKHRFWYSLKLPHWGSSNEYPQSIRLCIPLVYHVCNQSINVKSLHSKLHWRLHAHLLGGLNLGTFYARKLNFGMLLTQTFSFVLELYLGHALGCGKGSEL